MVTESLIKASVMKTFRPRSQAHRHVVAALHRAGERKYQIHFQLFPVHFCGMLRKRFQFPKKLWLASTLMIFLILFFRINLYYLPMRTAFEAALKGEFGFCLFCCVLWSFVAVCIGLISLQYIVFSWQFLGNLVATSFLPMRNRIQIDTLPHYQTSRRGEALFPDGSNQGANLVLSETAACVTTKVWYGSMVETPAS